jgi:hypothetical protein
VERNQQLGACAFRNSKIAVGTISQLHSTPRRSKTAGNLDSGSQGVRRLWLSETTRFRPLTLGYGPAARARLAAFRPFSKFQNFSKYNFKIAFSVTESDIQSRIRPLTLGYEIAHLGVRARSLWGTRSLTLGYGIAHLGIGDRSLWGTRSLTLGYGSLSQNLPNLLPLLMFSEAPFRLDL